METEQTQIVTRADVMDLIGGDRLHCLELSSGDDIEKRHLVTPLGLKIGRTPPADLVIPDSEISRSHCLVAIRDGELVVTDLNSTNGTFVDGVRVEGPVVLPIGSVLQVGKRIMKHEWRTRAEIEQSEDVDRDLQRAASYVQSLLPQPGHAGALRADWVYKPSAKLGGDIFGYGRLSDELYFCYLIDVAGHGAGAAMHAVAIANQLRQKALPNTDMARPDKVLGTLNDLFQMEDHDGLYFTIWYGVYDSATRRLDYASGGHHAAYLTPPGREAALALRTRNLVIGAMPDMTFAQASVQVPAGAACYIFSDGVFEIVDRAGREWAVEDFVERILAPSVEGSSEPQRLFDVVSAEAGTTVFEDDFSLVVISFE